MAITTVLAMCVIAPYGLASGATDEGYVAEVDGVQYSDLQSALNAAADGDTVRILSDIKLDDSDTSGAVIESGVTIDGTKPNGGCYTISSSTAKNVLATMENASFGHELTIRNLNIISESTMNNSKCLWTGFLGGKLVLENVTMEARNAANSQPLTIGGTTTENTEIIITESTIIASATGYSVICFNPVDLKVTGSYLEGWAVLYMKYQEGGGTHGSVIDVQDSEIVSMNTVSGESNDFAAVVSEDSDVTFNLTDVRVTIGETMGCRQTLFSSNPYTPIEGTNSFNIGGDKTVVTFQGENTGMLYIYQDDEYTTDGACTVTGGTFNFDPSEFVSSDCSVVENSDGTYSVLKNLTITFIHNGEVYDTLTVTSGSTITDVPVAPEAPEHYTYIWVDGNGDGVTPEPVTTDLEYHSALSLAEIDADVWTEYGNDGTIRLVGDFDSPVEGVVSTGYEWRVDGGSVTEGDTVAIVDGTHDYRLYIWLTDSEGVPGLASWVGEDIDSGSFVATPDDDGNIETENSTVVIKPDAEAPTAQIDTNVTFGTGGSTSGIQSTITISGTVNDPTRDIVVESKPITGPNPSNVPDVFTASIDVTVRNVVDFEMTISVPVTADPDDAIIGAVAYFYNEITGYLENVDCQYNPIAGTVDIFTDHNTKYYVALLTESNPVAPEVPTQPEEGDSETIVPPWGWDDDDDYVPPIVPSQTDDSGDDNTTTIVACAAAAVVAALMAAFLILDRRH